MDIEIHLPFHAGYVQYRLGRANEAIHFADALLGFDNRVFFLPAQPTQNRKRRILQPSDLRFSLD